MFNPNFSNSPVPFGFPSGACQYTWGAEHEIPGGTGVGEGTGVGRGFFSSAGEIVLSPVVLLQLKFTYSLLPSIIVIGNLSPPQLLFHVSCVLIGPVTFTTQAPTPLQLKFNEELSVAV